jgi:hypothetical protein
MILLILLLLHIAVMADCDDADMHNNNMLFDYMCGSSPESEDESGFEDDSDQLAVAPDPSELVFGVGKH